jgi:hypothetical protein
MRLRTCTEVLHHVLRTTLLSIALVGRARAQGRLGPSPGPAFALFRPAPTQPPARPVSFIHSSAPDYRWEGLAIGAIAVGVFAAYVVNGVCNDPDNGGGGCAVPTAEGLLFGATVGGVTGGLLGTLIPKNDSASTH